MECYTYMVACSDGSLYTGWTNALEKRIAAHNAKKGAKYTKSRTPVRLVYYECFSTKEEAMRREYEIKHYSRAQKEELVRESKALLAQQENKAFCMQQEKGHVQ